MNIFLTKNTNINNIVWQCMNSELNPITDTLTITNGLAQLAEMLIWIPYISIASEQAHSWV